jgi:hypothetical protein
LGFAAPVRAKIGETLPQLIRRFGKAYTTDSVEGGTRYKFRSPDNSTDVTLADGLSISETYFSDHSLNAAGEPPNDIVRAILKTNAPDAKWLEVDAAQFRAKYALRSSDSKYIAILNYASQQEEGVVWTMTVQNLKQKADATSSPTLPIIVTAEAQPSTAKTTSVTPAPVISVTATSPPPATPTPPTTLMEELLALPK